MKTCLTVVIFCALIGTGCNNSKEKGGMAAQENLVDSVSAAVADLSSVTDIKKLLSQDWENKEDAEDAAMSGGGEGLEIPYRGFSFFEDGNVVENPRDKMRFGKWTLNEADKLIEIDYAKGTKANYKIAAIGARQMILVNMADKKKTEYKADAKVEKVMADNPFYPTNNTWRIKPTKPESDSGIKERTEQCVLFYSKFLADNAARGGNIISFVGLPSCFKWYRGGVSVTAKAKVEDKWLNCYYNKDQAYKAHAMLESIIGKKYKWNKEERNWVKQSADVVRQMYDTLKVL